MGFDEVIGEELDKNNAEYPVVKAIFNMVLNRLSDPCSKSQLDLWQEEVYGIEKFESHQYYRAMDYLISNKDLIEQNLFYRMRDLRGLQAIRQIIQGASITMRTELKPGALLAFKFLNLKVPNRVLSGLTNLPAVVVRQNH